MAHTQTVTASTATTSVKNGNSLNIAWKAPEKVKCVPPQFASILAHEMRNPLTNINLSVGMLQELTTDGEQKLLLGIIQRSYVRMNDLINALLKNDIGIVASEQQQSVEQLLENVLLLVADRLSLKNIEVHKTYAPIDFQLIMDEPEMKIAFANIVINAIDAMAEQGGILTLGTRTIEGGFQICIEDNGCGIKKENVKKIAQPYYTTKPNGIGVGLALSYDILKKNGAEISLESKEGKGTCFMLCFNQHSMQPGKHNILPDQIK